MKKLYSYILLLSFLTGVIQPVLPMAEYVFSEDGQIATLLDTGNENICSISLDKENCDDCGLCDYPESDSLLDIEFYPIPLQVAGFSGEHILYQSAELYSGGDDQLTDFYYSTIPPPPKICVTPN